MAEAILRQAVPFFLVSDIQDSVRYYQTGLGFALKNQWIDKGKLRWCWLERDGAALMLQEIAHEGHHAEPFPARPGAGVSIYFICDDALAVYQEITARGIEASRPLVGNGMWVTELSDPDGYRLAFESPTDAPEETVLSAL